jgi:D-arabinose 1-dehydrogenase-like Zn-dependent alcohol dehydrogenase
LLDTLKTYQQRVIAPAAEVVVVPRDADPQQASMMAINPVTAELLLNEFVALKAGDAVVFYSATSGLSQWLITLAKERGIRTIGLVRKAADITSARNLNPLFCRCWYTASPCLPVAPVTKMIRSPFFDTSSISFDTT